LSFKGVVLEGLEVAFIALTFGANQRNIPLAAIAALAAVLVVTIRARHGIRRRNERGRCTRVRASTGFPNLSLAFPRR
jgi:uncharacterized membrane protein